MLQTNCGTLRPQFCRYRKRRRPASCAATEVRILFRKLAFPGIPSPSSLSRHLHKIDDSSRREQRWRGGEACGEQMPSAPGRAPGRCRQHQRAGQDSPGQYRWGRQKRRRPHERRVSGAKASEPGNSGPAKSEQNPEGKPRDGPDCDIGSPSMSTSGLTLTSITRAEVQQRMIAKLEAPLKLLDVRVTAQVNSCSKFSNFASK